jgi:hypothetical protein
MKIYYLYFSGDKTEEAKMGGAYGAYEGEEKFVFGLIQNLKEKKKKKV